jgi:hypothetical protein
MLGEVEGERSFGFDRLKWIHELFQVLFPNKSPGCSFRIRRPHGTSRAARCIPGCCTDRAGTGSGAPCMNDAQASKPGIGAPVSSLHPH